MPEKPTRDDVLRRMLKTPPTPHKPVPKASNDKDPMPTDDPEALVEWGKRNIQKDSYRALADEVRRAA